MSAILTTHKHADHSGGNEAVKAMFLGLKVYGGKIDNVLACTNPLDDQEEFRIGGINVRAYHAPCHTKGKLKTEWLTWLPWPFDGLLILYGDYHTGHSAHIYVINALI